MADATPIKPNNARPWEQMPGEPDSAFAAFTVFLGLGSHRNVIDAFRIVTGSAGKVSGSFQQWITSWTWWDRAGAYDAYEARQSQAARLTAAVVTATQQGVEAAQSEWAKRSETVREASWELFQKLRTKITEMMSVAIIRRKVIPANPQAGQPETIIYEPAKWSFFTMCQMVDTMDKIGRMACEMPTTLAELERIKNAGDGDGTTEAMFATTAGLLESAMPPGSVPAMPENPAGKPDIRVHREAAGSNLRQPPRIRPTGRPRA